MFDDLIAAVPDAQNQLAKSLAHKLAGQKIQKRASGNGRETFRPIRDDRLQAHAETAAKDQCVHQAYRGRGIFLLSRYQSIVLLSPSRNPTLARNPSSDSAL